MKLTDPVLRSYHWLYEKWSICCGGQRMGQCWLLFLDRWLRLQEMILSQFKSTSKQHTPTFQAPLSSPFWHWRSWTKTREAISASGACSSSIATSGGLFLGWNNWRPKMDITGWLDYMPLSLDCSPRWLNSSPPESSRSTLTLVSMHAKTLGAYSSGMI